MEIAKKAKLNFEGLKKNPYPGRGIVTGKTPDGKHFVQIYWIMGRSENSRNRVFVKEGEFVRIEPFDESKVKDPSLIIYYPVKRYENFHIVSNGDQTDTVFEFVRSGRGFEEAITARSFEPDEPHFTPRITGILEPGGLHQYRLSIIKSAGNDPQYCKRHFFCYEKAIPGIGHMIHTYAGDGAPLPSFEGEPLEVPLADDIDDNLEMYWKALNKENRVSLLVKFVDAQSGQAEIRIVNRHGS